jgi:hypothetical protein
LLLRHFDCLVPVTRRRYRRIGPRGVSSTSIPCRRNTTGAASKGKGDRTNISRRRPQWRRSRCGCCWRII